MFTGLYYYWTCPLRTRAEARNGYGASTVTHESTLLSTCPAPLPLPQKGQWQRGERIYVLGALVRNAFRLGLACKQPHLFQLNIIKVIKCLKIHAGFMSAWLWPRRICWESPLRMVGELGAMLSQSLKGVALGGFVSGFGSQLSMVQNLKTRSLPRKCRNTATQWDENTAQRKCNKAVLWPPEALCGCEWHLQVNGWGILVFGLIWKRRCIVLENKADSDIARWCEVLQCWWLPCSTVQGLASNSQ